MAPRREPRRVHERRRAGGAHAQRGLPAARHLGRIAAMRRGELRSQRGLHAGELGLDERREEPVLGVPRADERAVPVPLADRPKPRPQQGTLGLFLGAVKSPPEVAGLRS